MATTSLEERTLAINELVALMKLEKNAWHTADVEFSVDYEKSEIKVTEPSGGIYNLYWLGSQHQLRKIARAYNSKFPLNNRAQLKVITRDGKGWATKGALLRVVFIAPRQDTATGILISYIASNTHESVKVVRRDDKDKGPTLALTIRSLTGHEVKAYVEINHERFVAVTVDGIPALFPEAVVLGHIENTSPELFSARLNKMVSLLRSVYTNCVAQIMAISEEDVTTSLKEDVTEDAASV